MLVVTDEFDLATSAEAPGIIADHQVDGKQVEAQRTPDPPSQTTPYMPESSSPKRVTQEVCQITSRKFRLFLGTLSVSTMKKVTRPIDTNRRDRNVSYHHEVKVRFSSSFLNRGLMARFYANTIGGFNISHSLVAVPIVHWDTGIFADFDNGDTDTMTRKILNGEYSPNTTDIYGSSLLAMASQP